MEGVPHTRDLEEQLGAVATREDLAALLRELHVRADSPALRRLDEDSIARQSPVRLTKSTVADMLKGSRFPRKALLAAFVQACGVPAERLTPWTRAWERIAATEKTRAPADPAELHRLREQLADAQAQLAEERRRADQRVAEAEQRAEQAEQKLAKATAQIAAPQTPGPSRPGGGIQVVPFYLMCARPLSMTRTGVEVIDEVLPALHEKFGSDPVVADRARLCVISFSRTAQVLLPLSNISQATSLPALKAAAGPPSYSAAFTTLRREIIRDTAELTSDGYAVMRPIACLITDSRPPRDDPWPAAYRRLTDPAWAPHPDILAVGFGWGDPEFIAQIATIRAFVVGAPHNSVDQAVRDLTSEVRALFHRRVHEKYAGRTPYALPSSLDLALRTGHVQRTAAHLDE